MYIKFFNMIDCEAKSNEIEKVIQCHLCNKVKIHLHETYLS